MAKEQTVGKYTDESFLGQFGKQVVFYCASENTR